MLANEFEQSTIRTIKYEWNHYKTALLIFVLLLTVTLYITGYLQYFLERLGSFGYLGGFVSGFLYTFGASTPFAVATFFILAEDLNIWLLVVLGSVGGLFSEYAIYMLAKREARKTIKIFKKRKINLPKINSKFIKKISPLIAGIIIATPIPDEFAAVLFGVERYRLRYFLLLTFVSKFIGIFLIVGLGRIF